MREEAELKSLAFRQQEDMHKNIRSKIDKRSELMRQAELDRKTEIEKITNEIERQQTMLQTNKFATDTQENFASQISSQDLRSHQDPQELQDDNLNLPDQKSPSN